MKYANTQVVDFLYEDLLFGLLCLFLHFCLLSSTQEQSAGSRTFMVWFENRSRISCVSRVATARMPRITRPLQGSRHLLLAQMARLKLLLSLRLLHLSRPLRTLTRVSTRLVSFTTWQLCSLINLQKMQKIQCVTIHTEH